MVKLEGAAVTIDIPSDPVAGTGAAVGDPFAALAGMFDGGAHAVADLYQPLAEDRGVTIKVEADEAVAVLGVPSLLQRAAVNLLDNAVKFSPDGGTIIVRAFVDESVAALSVADQGPGIDPRLLSDPDRRAAAAEAEGRESHGLGLSFVRAVLRRHGGGMTIDDAAPGAIVTAHFPR